MAKDVMVKDDSSNSCCIAWKEKYTKLKERYTKLEEGRNALRQGLSIFEQQISKIQADNVALKKAFEEEKARADSMREEKEKESALKVSLENEVFTLRSEIQMLQENGSSARQDLDGEVQRLEVRISEGGKEINRLKALLEKERLRLDSEKNRADTEKKRADSEKMKADAAKKKADEALKKEKAEKNKVLEDSKLADVERKKAEEYKVQLGALKMEIDKVKSNYEDTKKKLEVERGKLSKEKKCAELAVAKTEEQRKLAEMNRKKAMDEKSRADILSQQLEQERQKTVELERDISKLVSFKKSVEVRDLPAEKILTGIAESTVKLSSDITKRKVTMPKPGGGHLKCEHVQQKLVNAQQEIIRERKGTDPEVKKAGEKVKVVKAHKKTAAKEKHRDNLLYKEVADNKLRIEEMQSVIESLLSSNKGIKSPSHGSIKSLDCESAEVKRLRKKLKFEKMLTKHAKQVAELEVGRNTILRQELHRLKQEFVRFSQHLDILDSSIFSNGKGVCNLEKIGSLNLKRKHTHVEPQSIRVLSEKELLKPCSTGSTAADGCHPSELSAKHSAPLLPSLEGSHNESISGIDSKLEPPHRGSKPKMLQSSAINSSSASFSDRPLVGSQEGGAFSVTTAAKFAEEKYKSEQSSSRLADNSVKGHNHGPAQEMTANYNINEELLDAVESVQNSNSRGQRHQGAAKNPSVLHCVLNHKIDQPFPMKGSGIPDLQGHIFDEDVRCSKRMKLSSEDVVPHLNGPIELKCRLGTSRIGEFDVCKQAPQSCCIQTESNQAQKNEINDYLCNPHLSFHDYIKLLELDNDADESSFRAAMERPLSPTLPDIEFRRSEILDVGYSKDSVEDCCLEKLLSVKDNVATCGIFDVIEEEIDSNKKLKSNDHGTRTRSLLQEHKGVVSPIKNLGDVESDIAQSGKPNASWIHDPSGEMTMTESGVGEKESTIPSVGEVASACGSFPRYLVAFSDIMDSACIVRTVSTIRTFLSQCSLISSSNFVRDILLVLAVAGDLSSKEKVCIFISLLLEYIHETLTKNSGDVLDRDSCQFIDSFSCDMKAVFSDIDTKRIFLGLWDLYDLLNLVEDFLLSGKVLVYGDKSSEASDRNFLNGNGTVLSAQAAPRSVLVAGGVLLASICASVDHIGFVCETSCNILRTQKSESSFVLTILHVFAHACGDRYLAEDYGLVMTVVRSLVVHLERLKASDKPLSCFSSLVDMPSNPRSCHNCPFLDGAASIDVVVSLLLEELHKYIITAAGRLNHVDSVCPSNVGAELLEEDQWKAFPSDQHSNVNASDLFDILSLVELVACFMNWEWSFNNIVHPVLKILESCPTEHFCAAVITLVGRLGRFGIDADGYDNRKVENLRVHLSAYLSQSPTRNLGSLVQIASATALVGLTTASFEELVNSNAKIPASADCFKKWFSSLSYEQQSLCRKYFSPSPGAEPNNL